MYSSTLSLSHDREDISKICMHNRTSSLILVISLFLNMLSNSSATNKVIRKRASQLIRVFPWDDLRQIKPGHPNTFTSQLERFVLPAEVDDDPGIADLRNRFTSIRSLNSRAQYQSHQCSQTDRHA